MSKIYRPAVVLWLSFVLALVADARWACAQRIVIGGGQNNQSNRDNDDDDDDDDQNNNNNNNRQRNRNRNQNQNEDANEKIQQFLQRRQGNQSLQLDNKNNNNNNNNSNNQFRRGNQQGQFDGGQQNNQFQQFQQFRPQGGGQNNLNFGNWQGNRWQGSRDVDNWSKVFNSGRKPFSSQWYKDHPKAWKYDHDHNDIWVVASLPGVYGWLGWGNVPQQPGVIIRNTPVDLSRFHDFYPLGVYSLMAGPGDMGTRIVQLAVDRHGHIAGNYYDMIADANYSISGDISRQSQRVSWSLNKNRAVRFRVPVFRLLQPYGQITVQLPGGEQDWQFVRLEN